jgi:hypothetical protein
VSGRRLLSTGKVVCAYEKLIQRRRKHRPGVRQDNQDARTVTSPVHFRQGRYMWRSQGLWITKRSYRTSNCPSDGCTPRHRTWSLMNINNRPTCPPPPDHPLPLHLPFQILAVFNSCRTSRIRDTIRSRRGSNPEQGGLIRFQSRRCVEEKRLWHLLRRQSRPRRSRLARGGLLDRRRRRPTRTSAR